MSQHEPSTRPVTVIGGYLGAGKTTLVNHLLRNANGLRIAVLVNEFGALPIDADLIEAQDDNIISIAGGCVCCSYGNDLILAMLDLAKMTPAPQHVLLEASGVAIPGAIASSVGLLTGYTLDGVVVLADAETLRQRADDHYMGDTVRQQLQDADILVLNKTDLIEAQQLDETNNWLASEFSDAKVIETEHAELPRDVVLGQTGSRRALPAQSELHHGKLFESHSFTLSGPLDVTRLAQALVQDELGVIRAKGFAIACDGTPYELQVVGRRWSATAVKAVPYTGIVCIGPANQLRTDLIAPIIADAVQ
ncbi:MAG: CobW family GTP-binding protein [Pseudomonadota bacterium]